MVFSLATEAQNGYHYLILTKTKKLAAAVGCKTI